MSKKITKLICFLVTAVMLCSCSAKGGDDVEEERILQNPEKKQKQLLRDRHRPGSCPGGRRRFRFLRALHISIR